MPAATGIGAGYNIGKGLYDSKEEIMNSITNMWNFDNSSGD
jgi:hypothetical protein